MRHWLNDMAEFLEENKEDLECLLYVGIPFGLAIVLLNGYFDFSHLF
jgi:hypothetical protein